MRGHVFVLVGPSGAGKTTLIRRVSGYDSGAAGGGPPPVFTFVPSTTTRPPRSGERHGVDYYFADDREFDARLGAEEFLEYQCVHGYRYGSSRARLREAVARGADAITAPDILGAFKIKAAMPADVTTVFVTPSSLDALRDRILRRGGVSPAELERRLARVAMEVTLAYACDHLVLNDDLEAAAAQIRLLAGVRRLEAARRAYFGRLPRVRLVEVLDPPEPRLGSRFCVADWETPAEAAARVLRQWWWELHPEATRFELPACSPEPAGEVRRECTPEAVLEVETWTAGVRAGALRA